MSSYVDMKGRSSLVLAGLLLAGTLMLTEKIGVAAEFANVHSTTNFADSATVLNNLANLYLQKADKDSAALDSAIALYQRAMQAAPDDPGIKLNLAIAFIMKDDTSNAETLIWQAYLKCDSSKPKLYSLLGLKYEESIQDKQAPRLPTEMELREWLEAGTDPKKKPTDRGGRPSGEPNKKDNTTRTTKKDNKKPTKKGIDPHEVKTHLYRRH